MSNFLNLNTIKIEEEDDENIHNHLYYILEDEIPIDVEMLKSQSLATASCSEDTFCWNRTNILLLINEYKKRVSRFRDPKMKKKSLWAEIRKSFFENGYNITLPALDRKWRNLKKTYTTIKAKTRRNGRVRMAWEYFGLFDEIYIQDKTMNIPATNSSSRTSEGIEDHVYCVPSTINKLHVVLSTSSAPSAQCTDIQEDHINCAPTTINTLHSVPSTSSAPSTRGTGVDIIALPDTINNCITSTSSALLPQTTRILETVQSPLLPHNDPLKLKTEKLVRNRALHNIRKKQKKVEGMRVKEIRLLRKAVETSNDIQRERNDIFREFLLEWRNRNT